MSGKDNEVPIINQNPADVKKQIKNIHNTLSRYWACTWDLILPTLYDENGMFRGKLNGPEACSHLECIHEERNLSLNNLQNYVWDLESNLRYKNDEMLRFWALITHLEASMIQIPTTPDFSTPEDPETVVDESENENDTNISEGETRRNIESDSDNEAEFTLVSDTEKGKFELPTFRKMAIMKTLDDIRHQRRDLVLQLREALPDCHDVYFTKQPAIDECWFDLDDIKNGFWSVPDEDVEKKSEECIEAIHKLHKEVYDKIWPNREIDIAKQKYKALVEGRVCADCGGYNCCQGMPFNEIDEHDSRCLPSCPRLSSSSSEEIDGYHDCWYDCPHYKLNGKIPEGRRAGDPGFKRAVDRLCLPRLLPEVEKIMGIPWTRVVLFGERAPPDSGFELKACDVCEEKKAHRILCPLSCGCGFVGHKRIPGFHSRCRLNDLLWYEWERPKRRDAWRYYADGDDDDN